MSVAFIKEILIRRPGHSDLVRRGSKKNLKPFFIDLAHCTQWIKYHFTLYSRDNNVIEIRFYGQSGYTSKSNNLS